MTGDQAPGALPVTTSVRLAAPAKLTLSLRVTGLRGDGYHLLDAEMVALDLADTLEITERSIGPSTLDVVTDPAGPAVVRAEDVPADNGNLVLRAIAVVDRRAAVTLTKRIPPGAGLGGGSADAGAVLRWAACDDPAVAAALGADVAFCVRGGRARVTGIGEVVDALPYEARWFLLLLSPFGVDTGAVYRAFDAGAGPGDEDPGAGVGGGNDLEAAAVSVEPRLAPARQALEDLTGRIPRLAGSGSTWFLEVAEDDPMLAEGGRPLATPSGTSWLVPARTVPAAV